jgi:hypothetical protein
LIRDLGRHDVSLPIVMDDALVNFDDVRARSAARVLVEFIAEQAADRQMLVLTCHEHVAKTFHEAGAHVRSFSDPRPIWDRRPAPLPAPVRVVPAPTPAPAPEPVAEPIVTASPAMDGDLWPAEAFFFGGGVSTPHQSAPHRAANRGGRRRRSR